MSSIAYNRNCRYIIKTFSYTHVYSPIILIAKYGMEQYYDGSEVAVCYTSADTFWSAFYFIASIMVFFVVPFIMLLLLYTTIAYKLRHSKFATTRQQPATAMTTPHVAAINITFKTRTLRLRHNKHHCQQHQPISMQRHRKQVILMLVAVVTSFFICLMPFRAFTLWIIMTNPSNIATMGIEAYYNILYFCRIMLYLNSALNPILYNLMSSKFRNGFWRLIVACCYHKRQRHESLKYTHNAISRRRFNTATQFTESVGYERRSPGVKSRRRILNRDITLASSTTSSTQSGAEHSSWRTTSLSTTTTTSSNTKPSIVEDDVINDVTSHQKQNQKICKSSG